MKTKHFFTTPALAVSLFLSSWSVAAGTVGQITALQPEKGLIQIDNRYFRVSAHALKSSSTKLRSLSDLKAGQIVNYENNDSDITSLVVLQQLQALPQ
ncbi:MAG TPA: hypothetical protein DIW43_11335 [Spongiibacteraceae bacterium]|nr:hypothetical protein [Spongiibacteraceae bacterium]HCS28039.1 hypothetical protein [Spongiibacteraceae bacterium]|tara:strand:+ start:543 stop:836 length:294 start_codon:yes stop_codon:yes gene_type:complete